MNNEIIKTTAIIVISAVLIMVLRNRLAEYSILLVLTTAVVIIVSVFGSLFGAIEKLEYLISKSENTGEYFTIALKALGISYIATFAADLCRDFGLSALAQTAEITGKISIFVLSMPLVAAVMKTALKFVGL